MAIVAVDAGQSGVRGVVVLEGGAEQRADGAGFAEPLADPGAPARVAGALAAFVGRLTDRPADMISVGLSGLDRAGEDALAVAQLVRDATGARRVRLANDIVPWHLAAFGGGPGVVAAVGTGSVALAADGTGRCARADGWGHLLGDQASGFAIGRAGLACALAELDGRGGSAALLERAGARFGPGEGIAAAIHRTPSPVAAIAAFAMDVAAAAAAGDPDAREIWEAAGRALGRMVLGARRRAFPDGAVVPVAVAGSLVSAGDLLLGPCAAELAPHGLVAEPCVADPLAGALRLASGTLAAYPGFVVEVGDA